MQILTYEASWDKAISKHDREKIETIFSSLHTFPPFTVIRHAVNHKGELLVTAIVHNTADKPLLFQERRIVYTRDGKKIADNSFTLSSFLISPKTSMPWTFIYPVGKWAGSLDILGELDYA